MSIEAKLLARVLGYIYTQINKIARKEISNPTITNQKKSTRKEQGLQNSEITKGGMDDDDDEIENARKMCVACLRKRERG